MDFWAGLVSGAAAIVIGNPFDIIKVHLQISKDNNNGINYTNRNNISSHNCDKWKVSKLISSLSNLRRQEKQHRKFIFFSPRRKNNPFNHHKNNLWLIGIAAPVLGYGGLNGLLFMTYNRMITLLNNNNNNESNTATDPSHDKNDHQLWTTFVAGAVGGLATWIISTPTELIKCRAQAQIRTHDYENISAPTIATYHQQQQQQNYFYNRKNPATSWEITKKIIRYEGIRGLYFGGLVTALRDSIGYGFYFWTYTLTTRTFTQLIYHKTSSSSLISPIRQQDVEVAKMLICGGIAGIATWASIFPLDMIKSRLQTQLPDYERKMNSIGMENNNRIASKRRRGRLTALKIFRNALVNEGSRVFFRGLTVCSIRAFIVNAVQWSIYEWIMQKSSNLNNEI
ncbi:Solute carrier family 25 member 45 [Erysiphe neolycopersici]|uniref:Solute carrier family 25 member 45 n=1 Tax=Erysiphe neolycopersici TaxID=212602 RepID=A0A420HCV5_9PEZI|nr:Solute carrier family 25 member 45 [Erysiphe neolycopersici]